MKLEKITHIIHIYLFIRQVESDFKQWKNVSPGHIEQANGTSQQNKDYIKKEGKWAKDKKADTNLKDTFEEFGEMPVERQGQRNDLHDLYDMIKRGFSNFDILETDASYILQVEKVEKVRQIVKEEEFKNTFRKLDISYIWGTSESGKTRFILETYGYPNVFRINRLHTSIWWI